MSLSDQLSRYSAPFIALVLLCSGCAKKHQAITLPPLECAELSEQEFHVKYSQLQEERDKESVDQIIRSAVHRDMDEAIHKVQQHLLPK